MKNIDIRFSDNIIKSINLMVGKTMVKYRCDPFEFSTSVYGQVGIEVDNEAFVFSNFAEVMDYYGNNEDVAVFKMKLMPFNDIKSKIQGMAMVETPINDIISEINIVNEHQKLFERGVQTYDVWLTRGIIFKFQSGNELFFEKSVWFSEDISVEKGYNVIERYTSVDEFKESWSGDYTAECDREIIMVK